MRSSYSGLISSTTAAILLVLANDPGKAIAADSAQEVASLLEKANSSYQAGSCADAIPSYHALMSRADAAAETRDLSLFRWSYCQLDRGNSAAAEKGFSKYLVKFPSNDEARLKLAQSYFNQYNFNKAKELASAVRAEAFRPEAVIYSARSSIELGNPGQAIETLQTAGAPAAWKPAFDYWQAVARYHTGNEQQALAQFIAVRDNAPAGHWAKADAQAWIDGMKEEDRRLHLQATGGYFYDGNVAQSLYRTMSAGGGGAPPPGGGGVPPPGEAGSPGGSQTQSSASAPVVDKGFTASGEISYVPFRTHFFKLWTSADIYTSHYLSQTSYNYESVGTKIGADYQLTRSLQASILTSYLDTRYAYAYYQDYVGATASVAWLAARTLRLQFSFPATINVITRASIGYAPALSFRFWPWSWITFFGGGSYNSTNGVPAVYSIASGFPETTSGTVFSRYTSFGGYAGAESSLPFGLNLSGQFSIYRTNYAAEAFPPPPEPSPPSRSDTQWAATGTVSRAIIGKTWSMALNVTYTSNASSGFPGLGSGGSIPDNNYTRLYSMLTTSIAY